MSLFCAFFAAFQKLQKICLLSTVLFSPLCCGLSSRREAELHEGSFTQVSKILAVWLEYQTVQTKSQGSKCVAKESFIGKALPSAISSSASWQLLAPPSWWSRRARWSPSHGWIWKILEEIDTTEQNDWLAMIILPKGRSHLKKTVKKGDIGPFWRPPPLNGSKGDICCLITDKSA